MELIYGENFQYPFPHVTFYLVDNTEIDNPVPALGNTASMVMFIMADEGIDDAFIKFSGSTAMSDFNAMFGDINIKKYGILPEFAKKHIQAGGELYVRRLVADDALLANAMLQLEIAESSVTFFVESGELYAENDVGETRTEVTIDSYTINSLIENKSEIATASDLDMLGASDLKTTVESGDPAIVPIYGFVPLGKGKWGNDLKLLFSNINEEVSGHQLKNYTLYNTKKGTIIDDFPISHVPELSTDGIPVNLPDVINLYSGKLGVSFYENNYYAVDDILDTIIDEVITALEADTSGADLTGLIAKLEDIKTEVNDTDSYYLDNLDIFGDLFPDDEDGLNLNLVFPNDLKTEIELTNGDDGAFKYMRNFDWDFVWDNSTMVEANSDITYDPESDGDIKVVENLFVDAWNGTTDPTIYDMQKVQADVVVDFGYPVSVKEAISSLVKNKRSDIVYVYGAPTAAGTISELETHADGFDPENMQMLKIGQTCNYRDSNNKIHRIPISSLLYSNLIDHYANGYKEPFAGNNVYISGIISGSILPSVNTLDEKTRMENLNFNLVSRDTNGYFLNGQMTNIKGKYSKLKEFFNILIKGRMMKVFLPLLEARKHKLDTLENIESVRGELETEMNDRFGGKVHKLEVEWLYKNELERARGDVTMELYWYPNGSIKRYRALMITMPKQQ